MHPIHLPTFGARYWTALVLASVLGTNTGDFAAHDLGLGHLGGLLPLALLFAAILFAERRSRASTEAFYWAAILALRTAATNLADFADHDLRLAPLLVLSLLALALAALVLADGSAFSRAGSGEGPTTDSRYWVTMLTAGVFGTALGDYLADDLGLAPGLAAVVTLPVAAALIALRRRAPWRTKVAYWVTVLAVRTAGTNGGDWLASREGLGLGLVAATTLSACAFCAVLALWPRPLPALAERGV